ncbi:hypothetical protein HCTETULN_190 [Candidatus Hodgkinia cicadicola]|nr:hypothetical protein HCTETULN_190 [Candidatus Hodgkinia cicadicola]
MDLFVRSRLNFEARASAPALRGAYRFVRHKACKLILLRDGLFWLRGSARLCNANCARPSERCNRLLVCCTRDFVKTLAFCALLRLGINCTVQCYRCGYCSENFGLLKFEANSCLNPLVRIQLNAVANIFWLQDILKFVALSKRLRLTSYVYLFGRVPERSPTPFVLNKLERAFAVLLD